MNTKLRKVLITVMGILLVILFCKSLVIGSPKTGIVFDSVTKEALAGIPLIRFTESLSSGFHGTAQKYIRSQTIVTDSEGKFNFPFFIKFKWPNQNYRELLSVNENGSVVVRELENREPEKTNEKYHKKILGLGFSDGFVLKDRRPYQGFEPFNNHVQINLAPVVFVVAECKNDKECTDEYADLLKSCTTTPYNEPGSDPHCKNIRNR